MTAIREAIVLPALLLTVAWLGGLRAGTTVQLLPPPLVSLVLAVMLIGTLIRSGALSISALMNANRTWLENLSGAAVTIALFAASAQVFNLVTPDQGIFHAAFTVGFFIQLATTLAGVKGRRNLLRSLSVLLGAAFVVRFVILESLYAPEGGLAKRLLTSLLEGASLGSIQYQPTGAITGYVGFLTLTLYLTAIVLLPPALPRGRLTVRALRAPSSTVTIAAIAAMLGIAGCSAPRVPGVSAHEETPGGTAARLRGDALAAARVWTRPTTPIGQYDFTANPPGDFVPSDEVSCRFSVQKLTGATPKFHCELADGRVLKIKYGEHNAELQAEIAGTRLLRSLGFATDDMFVVRAVRCAGCPRFPFTSLKCADRLGLELPCFGGSLDYSRIRTFTTAVIERRMEGTPIEAFDDQGWSWFELDRIDPARGGSSRAEVDAFRLLAVLLAHWDNKAPNQRLVCRDGSESTGGACTAPVAMIQDLGATFGPNRVDLPSWRQLPVWQDRSTCTVSMETLPYNGATFPAHRVSDAGRQLMAGLLEQLTEKQLEDLFTASRITLYDQIDGAARMPAAWVNVFKDKVRQIREGAPCPQ